MLDDLTTLIATGQYIAAIGGALVAVVGVLRLLLALRFAWFKTKLGGYVLGYTATTLVYGGSALHSGTPLTLTLVIAAIGAGWAASGGWETFRDVMGWFKARATSGDDSGSGAAGGAGPSIVSALISVLLVVGFLSIPVGLASCGWWHTKPATAVIDCVSADQAQIAGLAGELAPLVTGSSVDWSAIYERAKDAGKVIGGCVLSELVQDYLGGKKAISTDESWAARDALERFRTEEAAGATFRTSKGDL